MTKRKLEDDSVEQPISKKERTNIGDNGQLQFLLNVIKRDITLHTLLVTLLKHEKNKIAITQGPILCYANDELIEYLKQIVNVEFVNLNSPENVKSHYELINPFARTYTKNVYYTDSIFVCDYIKNFKNMNHNMKLFPANCKLLEECREYDHLLKTPATLTKLHSELLADTTSINPDSDEDIKAFREEMIVRNDPVRMFIEDDLVKVKGCSISLDEFCKQLYNYRNTEPLYLKTNPLFLSSYRVVS